MKCEGFELLDKKAICTVELSRSESVSIIYAFVPRQQHLDRLHSEVPTDVLCCLLKEAGSRQLVFSIFSDVRNLLEHHILGGLGCR